LEVVTDDSEDESADTDAGEGVPVGKLASAHGLIVYSSLTRVKWREAAAKLEWVADHPLLPRSVWLVDLAKDGQVLKGKMALSRPASGWQSLSLTLSSDEGFVGNLRFSRSHLVDELRLQVPVDATWVASAIVTMEKPVWAPLVGVDARHDVLRPIGGPMPFVIHVPLEDATLGAAENQMQEMAAIFKDVRGGAVQIRIEAVDHAGGTLKGVMLLEDGTAGGGWSATVVGSTLRIRIVPEQEIFRRVWVSGDAIDELDVQEDVPILAAETKAVDVMPAAVRPTATRSWTQPMLVHVEPLAFAAAVTSDVTIGQLASGRYTVNISDGTDLGLRAQLEIQPYGDLLRIRLLSGVAVSLASDPNVSLSGDRWTNVKAEAGTSVAAILEDALRINGGGVRSEDSE
jgi:hypothetical protein